MTALLILSGVFQFALGIYCGIEWAGIRADAKDRRR